MKRIIYLFLPLLFIACEKEEENFSVSARVGNSDYSTKNVSVEVNPQNGQLSTMVAQFTDFSIGFKIDNTQPTFAPGDYHFRTGNMLPATLISFRVEVVNGEPRLKWSTGQEVNVQSFTIERSQDGLNFSALGTVPATNTSSVHDYEFPDQASNLVAKFYYRLKATDTNGQFSYSQILVYTNQITYTAYLQEGSDKFRGYNGLVKVTSHDYNKKIVEGNFYFDIKTNAGLVKEVRNGSFRIRY